MKKQLGYTAVELAIVLAFLAVFCIAGGILYAVFHFIGKFW